MRPHPGRYCCRQSKWCCRSDCSSVCREHMRCHGSSRTTVSPASTQPEQCSYQHLGSCPTGAERQVACRSHSPALERMALISPDKFVKITNLPSKYYSEKTNKKNKFLPFIKEKVQQNNLQCNKKGINITCLKVSSHGSGAIANASHGLDCDIVLVST